MFSFQTIISEYIIFYKITLHVSYLVAKHQGATAHRFRNAAIMSRAQVSWWVLRFKAGQVSVDQQKTWTSSTRYSRLTNWLLIQETAEEVGMSYDSYHAILNENLSTEIASAKFIPLLSKVDQTKLRFSWLLIYLNTQKPIKEILKIL